jgi:hypothetical protein
MTSIKETKCFICGSNKTIFLVNLVVKGEHVKKHEHDELFFAMIVPPFFGLTKYQKNIEMRIM